MRTSPTIITLACVAALHAPCAFGAATEEDELALVYGDKATVSIATGSKQPLRRAPAVATVITAQDIAAMGATDLDEVLETVPGLHVARNNVLYNPLYVIRGIYSEYNPQTLVLQNGVPMTTLFTGNRGLGWSHLPLENVARVEIIRGPGSALYGADAFSGVVNIITKGPADVAGAELGLRAGSFDTRSGWAQYGGRLGAVDTAAYLGVARSDGFDRTVQADAQSGIDTLLGTHASLAPGPVNTGYDAVDAGLDLAYRKWRLRTSYRLRSDIGTGAGVSAALDPVGKGRSERLIVDLSWNDVEIAPDWKLTLGASHQRYEQGHDHILQLLPPGAFAGSFPDGMLGAPNTWERHTRLSAVATYAGFAGHTLRLGVGHDDLDMYRTQELKNFTLVDAGPAIGQPVPLPGGEVVEFPVEDSFLTPHRRRDRYVYLQDEWAFARDWTLTAGLRHDRYSDFGGTTNPRVALVWDASLDVTAKLLYGRAFRAPAFVELYSINNPVNRGNPDLLPETIRTLEAAVSWQARPDTQLNLNLFRYSMDDIIRLVPTGGGVSMFHNVGGQHGHGGELEAIWDASRTLRLSGHYAYQRSIDESSGADAGYAPRHHLYGRADWRFANGWLASAQANHVADRARAPGDARPPIRDYTTLDLTLRTGRAEQRWEVAASVRNVFDADVREPSLAPGTSLPYDLPMAPRTLYLQFGLRM